MKALKFSALALILASLPVAAQAGGKSHGGMMRPGVSMGGVHAPRAPGQIRNWGGKHQGRWVGGWRAPGGWGAYRRPYVGYVLPRYWINPTWYIGNYGSYGFAQPSYGYGWSRYYDDAVMTDRYGRVQDYVQGVNWGDDYDYGQGYGAGQGGYGYQGGYQGSYQPGYDDRYARPKDRDGGLGGALIGGTVGAVAGGLIAKRGDNTEGAIIGGVVGAVAGAAIDAGDNTGRGYKTRKRYSNRDMDYGRSAAPMGYDYGYDGGAADGVTYNGHWAGTWTGSFDGGPTRTWSGTFDGNYRGQNAAPVAVAPQGPQGGHWGGGYQGGAMMHHQGMWQGGYGGGETTVTVHSQPVTTTTTEIIEETVYVSKPVVRKRYAPKRIVRAKPKPRCVCKVVYR
jgi:hypothetical protein